MKIYNTPIDAIKAYTTGSAQGVQPVRTSQQSQANSTAHTSDKVDISTAVKLMQDIHQAIKEAPEVRVEKVAQVEAAITSGTYKADLTVVAQKLLSPNISDRI